AELLGQRFTGSVGLALVNGTVAICTPVTLEFTGIQIDNRHALAAVAIGQENFVCLCIDSQFCNLAEVRCAVAVSRIAWLTVLGYELSVTGEYEDVRVAATIAADPYVAVWSYVNTMV